MTTKKFKAVLLFLLLIPVSGISQMYWNQAALFTGSNARYISVPNSSTLNITGSFTIEAWINPATLSGASKGIISKGGALGTSLIYALRLLNTGKIQFITNGSQRLVSKTAVQINQWTHIAAVYESSLNTFYLFINGISDTIATVASAAPISNTDSLFIGISGTTTPFNGSIDEVKIWNTNLSGLAIQVLFRNSLGVVGNGIFQNLVLSMTMQNPTGAGTLFSTSDFSGKGNHGFAKNVIVNDMKDRPLNHLQMNACIDLSGTPGYVSMEDNANVSPTSVLTIEMWIFPKISTMGIIYKGPYFSFNPSYQLHLSSGKLRAYINNTLISSSDSVKLNRWNHIAFTYFGTSGRYEFYINGKRGTTGNKTPGNITNDADSLLLGTGGLGSASFNGFIDELRIFHDVKSINEINNTMYESINESNDDDGVTNAVYNFDGSNWGCTDGTPLSNMRNANYTYTNNFSVSMQSPVNGYYGGTFHKGFYIKYSDKRIPATGNTGLMRDTIDIPLNENISDLNIYIALQQRREDRLRMSLQSPTGTSVEFYSNHNLIDSAGNIVTVFDSDADSLIQNNRFISFSPKIKPQFDLDGVFSGVQAKGKWILTINDDGGPDTGVVIAWGIQFNNKTSTPLLLNCTSLIQGFYDASSNTTITDTVRYELKSAIFPFPVIESSKSVISNTGVSQVTFNTADILTGYFLLIYHRNSLETWSSSLVTFPQFSKSVDYDFTNSITKAFGNNMIQVDASPVRFATYSGDVNQDGTIEATDLAEIDNDASNFETGYIDSDVNGDGVTDGSDGIITANNSENFVSVIRP
ncbi:MAG: hypothetical protein HGGPFJEG_01104 [Ignavibacteria bacterium]|nr:hypothetical protein [Ignavibacteria bacterium]